MQPLRAFADIQSRPAAVRSPAAFHWRAISQMDTPVSTASARVPNGLPLPRHQLRRHHRLVLFGPPWVGRPRQVLAGEPEPARPTVRGVDLGPTLARFDQLFQVTRLTELPLTCV